MRIGWWKRGIGRLRLRNCEDTTEHPRWSYRLRREGRGFVEGYGDGEMGLDGS